MDTIPHRYNESRVSLVVMVVLVVLELLELPELTIRAIFTVFTRYCYGRFRRERSGILGNSNTTNRAITTNKMPFSASKRDIVPIATQFGTITVSVVSRRLVAGRETLDDMADDETKLDASPVEIGPSPAPFAWSERRERAAFLLAEDELTDEQIAAECGVTRATLATWKRHPDFRARMSEHVKTLESAIVHIGVTRKRNRVARLQRIVDRLERVIEERAAVARIGEEETGLIVSKPVFSHTGELEYEYKFDAALVREYRATLEQVAKELGQLSERIEIEQETIVRRYVGVNMEDV